MSVRVSIIVPCYNEEHTIGLLLEAIYRQTYNKGDLEVIIADGMSTDGTREHIEAFSRDHSDLLIRTINNEDRIIPAALNRAIQAAEGDIIIRLDAHSAPQPDYIENCVGALEEAGVANVGGVWEIQPSGEGSVARAIAIAAAHPLGAGDARYRVRGKEGEVDTVPFGAFRREWIERIGPFDESLQTNEDYEYNFRLRQAGGVVWFDPSIRSTYYSRQDFRSLAKQYARYGYWKARMLVRNPTSIRWRQMLPPLFVLSIFLLGVTGFFSVQARVMLGGLLGIYGIVIFLAGVFAGAGARDLGLIISFPVAIGIMHFTWGGAFLWSLLESMIRRST